MQSITAVAIWSPPNTDPPPAELQIRGDYHRLPLVCIGEDLEEQPRPVRVEREKPELVDDEQAGLADERGLPVEPPVFCTPPGTVHISVANPRSASRTPATHSSLPSSAGLPLLWGIGAACDMSSMSAYFATVFRRTWRIRTISDLERPAASIDRISFTDSRGTVISSILPGRARQSNRPGKPYGEGRAPGPRGAALLLKLLNFSCSRCLIPSDHSDHF